VSMRVLLRAVMPLFVSAVFIGEGLFAGKVFSGYQLYAPAPRQILQDTRFRPLVWPLARLTEEVRAALPAGSPLASALRMESVPDPVEQMLRLDITGKEIRPAPSASSVSLSAFQPPAGADNSIDSSPITEDAQSRIPLRWNYANGCCEFVPGPNFQLRVPSDKETDPPDPRAESILNRAVKYRQAVNTWSRHFNLKPQLVFAIIYTESSFNPLLVSSRDAHGLMQVVPDTAGNEVKHWLGESGKMTRAELLDPFINIKYGAGYFRLLLQRYFGPVRDALSREYCAIAAYNSGSGPVLKVFGNSRQEAFDAINALNADEVLNLLLDRIPMRETRTFIRKVLTAQQHFIALFNMPEGQDMAARTVARN